MMFGSFLAVIGAMAFQPSTDGVAMAENEWTLVETLDPNLSFKVPCAMDQIVFRTEGLPDVMGTNEARCATENFVYNVSVTQFLVSDDNLIFEELSERLFEERQEGVVPITLQLEGHRSIADRGQVDDVLGQRALIEITPAKVAFVIVSGNPSVPDSVASQRTMIDQFFTFLQVKT